MSHQNTTSPHLLIIAVLLLLVAGLLGCSEDETPTLYNRSLIPKPSYLTAFYQSEELLYSYQYANDKSLVKQIVSYPDGNFVSEFEYNSIGKISKMIGVRNGLILELDIYYNEHNQIDSIFSVSDGSPWVINKFIYDQEQQLTRMIEFAPGTRSLVYNDYVWSEGDLVRRETYFPREDERLEDRWVLEYEYDSLINPFKLVYNDVGFHLIEREPISQHNWTSVKIYNKNTGNVLREIDKEYQYLGTGFPYRKRTYVYNGGNRSEQQEGVVADFFY